MTQNSQKQVFEKNWKEIQNANFTDNEKLIATNITSFFVQPDGTQLFVTRNNNIEVYDFAIPYDVNSIVTPAHTAIDFGFTNMTAIFFKPDGTRLFFFDSDGEDLYQFDVPVPFDISSIPDPLVNQGSNGISDIEQIAFQIDGSSLYYTVNGLILVRVMLTVPWDITGTGTLMTKFPAELNNYVLNSMTFKPEGDRMYILDIANNKIGEFSLPIPWDLTTVNFIGEISPSVVSNQNDIHIRSNGKEIFTFDSVLDSLFKFHFNKNWIISTASYFPNVQFLTISDEIRAVKWRPDGLKCMVLIAGATDKIIELTVPTPFNLEGFTETASLTVGAQESNPSGMDWSDDGKVIIIIGSTVKAINSYNVTTGWDLSTASPFQSVIPSGQDGNPRGVQFGDRGNLIFVMDSAGEIMKYTLAAPYILGSMNTTPAETLDVSVNVSGANNFVFKPDGLFLYVVARNDNTVVIFRFTENWILTGAVFVDFLDLDVSGSTSPIGLDIKKDKADKLFIGDVGTDTIYTFDVSSEFNNSLITEFGDELVTELGELLVH